MAPPPPLRVIGAMLLSFLFVLWIAFLVDYRSAGKKHAQTAVGNPHAYYYTILNASVEHMEQLKSGFNPLTYRMPTILRSDYFKFFLLPCLNPLEEPEKTQEGTSDSAEKVRKHYVTLSKFVVASEDIGCNQSITFTTHGEFYQLDNLVPIVERWQGPVSVAVYAPGSDFLEAVLRIRFLRSCTSPLVRKLVTFHLFFDAAYEDVTDVMPVLDNYTDCSFIPSFESSENQTFRRAVNLIYPINAARNLARREARTHFVLASDIDTYPSLHFILRFFVMIGITRIKALSANVTTDPSLPGRRPYVYLVPTFEVEELGELLPMAEKIYLLNMVIKGKAGPYSHQFCSWCNFTAVYEDWMEDIENTFNARQLSVMDTLSGNEVYKWEPVFVMTNNEPWFDEEVQDVDKDVGKMSLAFAMCQKWYEYKLLDNAFLIHRPRFKGNLTELMFAEKNKEDLSVLLKSLRTVLTRKYGYREECELL